MMGSFPVILMVIDFLGNNDKLGHNHLPDVNHFVPKITLLIVILMLNILYFMNASCSFKGEEQLLGH